jgi:hypothetical protein
VSGLVPARLETVQRPRLQRLLRYWHDRRRNRPMPSRTDIDPLDMPWILGNLSLLEVHRPDGGGLRYRYRLMGSRVAQRLHYDLTGKWLEEMIEPGYRERLYERYATIVAERQPMIERPNLVVDGRIHDYEILRLPLSSDGETVDMLVLAVEFKDSPAWSAVPLRDAG